MFNLINDWELLSFFIFLGLLLFVAKLIKEKLPFLNRIIIPSALIAGFLGLVLSDGFLGVINLSEDVTEYSVYYDEVNFVPFTIDDLDDDELSNFLIVTYGEAVEMGFEMDGIEDESGNDVFDTTDNVLLKEEVVSQRIPVIYETVYHALAIGFIALTLRREENPTDKKVWSTGMIIVITYLLQALVGVAVVALLFKDIFLGAGLLLPLGFGQGPGLATTQGYNYSTNGLGVLTHGGALGASIASMGFLVGGIIGVIALNYFARKNSVNVEKVHREESLIKETFEMETIKEIRVFDALTMQLVIIFLIYGCVYLTLAGLETLLGTEGIGGIFAGVFHGFNFLIGIIYALIYRAILTKQEKNGRNVKFLTNNYILSNISSVAFNFMIIASVLTITNVAVEMYYGLILALAAFGTLITFVFLKWVSKKIYSGKFEIHYFIGMFGMLTGTASTGLALLKGVDKDLNSPVAEEMVVGSGTAISMALPLFALLSFPTLAYAGTPGIDAPIYNVLVFVVPAVYALILTGILLYVNRKK